MTFFNNYEHKVPVSYACTLSMVDQKRLAKFIEAEATFHDAVLAHLDPIMRTQPSELLAIDGSWRDLYGVFATVGIRPCEYRHGREGDTLPQALEPYRNLVLGKDTSGKRHLTETKMIILDAATRGTQINGVAKTAIALEVLSYMQDQAKEIIRCKDKPLNSDFSEPYAIFSPLCTIPRWGKRYIQIPRELVTWHWDRTNKVTEITTPYNTAPIKIAHKANKLKEDNWTVLVIVQTPQQNAAPSWRIDLVDAGAGYAIKYHQTLDGLHSKKKEEDIIRGMMT